VLKTNIIKVDMFLISDRRIFFKNWKKDIRTKNGRLLIDPEH
jgi:hypothetical protein